MIVVPAELARLILQEAARRAGEHDAFAGRPMLPEEQVIGRHGAGAWDHYQAGYAAAREFIRLRDGK